MSKRLPLLSPGDMLAFTDGSTAKVQRIERAGDKHALITAVDNNGGIIHLTRRMYYSTHPHWGNPNVLPLQDGDDNWVAIFFPEYPIPVSAKGEEV